MKTQDFVKKHKLDQSPNFNHEDFITDLTLEFMSLLKVGNATKNLKGYENAIRAIRMKWDAISNKVNGGTLPEGLWKYFYATVVASSREQLFPEEIARRKKEKEDRAEFFRKEKLMDEYLSYEAFRWDALSFEEFCERKKSGDPIRGHHQGFAENFFHFFLGGLFLDLMQNMKPVEEFMFLGLSSGCTDKEEVIRAYRAKSLECHPDKGGSSEDFIKLQDAKNKCLAYLT